MEVNDIRARVEVGLEEARDASFSASKQIAALVNAYLARAYASNHDAPHFYRAIDTAQAIADNLGTRYGDGTDYVFHRISGILAERSYGYLELHEPKKTLEMQQAIISQIRITQNAWLHAWIPLDWARAYLMIDEVDESAKAAQEFLHRAQELQSPHTIGRAFHMIDTLEKAGYADHPAVRALREETNAARVASRLE
jgi:hypothetical protein